jgi:hypothetical protein
MKQLAAGVGKLSDQNQSFTAGPSNVRSRIGENHIYTFMYIHNPVLWWAIPVRYGREVKGYDSRAGEIGSGGKCSVADAGQSARPSVAAAVVRLCFPFDRGSASVVYKQARLPARARTN